MSSYTRQSNIKPHPLQYGKVWLFFMYYWLIFGISTYVGQFLPLAWRQPLSIALLILILLTMIVQRARFSGPIMSHIYTIVSGLLSYATFTVALQDLGPSIFFKNVLLAIVGFVIFGCIGFFLIKDASSIGKYLFVVLIALIVASLVGWFIHNPIYHTLISLVGLLLFLLYTLYDFNRMKRGTYSPREMGFNLFLNLFRIIRYVLNLARYARR
ncbi:Bax inhibitor-1 family protein [Staphylococcus agnetis]|uniref:Bax inhibitor-1/YccA family protein n=1 Tax=Staphylococcus agnetis TaxID=985762 RepID=UPI00208DF153|nr:Bax inhibitor-1 family protein [Staphylococcus agnetis]MCO4338323.1 Bax inhibitor-1 family protein [Staphylococcus agnetis]MCO4341815.1 Bax inhibitor-1 family protein [Staphylococcus agnetis]MCO4343943.1 Bax inhibitor-1 family protein [Staphylococcus agnetis]MCO4346082.1 Bax inhibitor-1 family protein [Staphylococcus agnetis]MCO4348878.1 Bax inhibitor-1 family protein [Staphylococcus agnetis]